MAAEVGNWNITLMWGESSFLSLPSMFTITAMKFS
jgi:hypothetical protein